MGKCAGVEWMGESPFSGLFGELGEKALIKYTNADLWALFAPDSDTIPYIYEQFDTVGDCVWDLMDPSPSSRR